MNATCLGPASPYPFSTTPTAWMRSLLAATGFAPDINCYVAVQGWSLMELHTGDAADTFVADGAVVDVLVALGNGNDTVSWTRANAGASFELGIGADQVTLESIQQLTPLPSPFPPFLDPLAPNTNLTSHSYLWFCFCQSRR